MFKISLQFHEFYNNLFKILYFAAHCELYEISM